MTDLTMKILSNVKPLWGVATLCYSLCSTPALAMPRNSHLNVQTLSSLQSTLLQHPNRWCGAPILLTSSKSYRLLDYLEIISTVQCSYKEHGTLTRRQSAALTRRVVAQMKQQQFLSPNETVSCTCTKCVLIETDTQTTRYWIF